MALAITALAGVAEAEEFVRHDCRPSVQATDGLKFENPVHALWYRRFWTGACSDLSLCIPGAPNWNEVVGRLLVKGGPSERMALLPKACRLGQLVGMEWARDRRIKRIKTDDLRTFYSTLEASGDTLRGVEQVELQARAMIASRR